VQEEALITKGEAKVAPGGEKENPGFLGTVSFFSPVKLENCYRKPLSGCAAPD